MVSPMLNGQDSTLCGSDLMPAASAAALCASGKKKEIMGRPPVDELLRDVHRSAVGFPTLFGLRYTPPVTSKKGVIGCGSPKERGQKPQHRTGLRLFCSCPSFGGPDGEAQASPVTLRVPRSSTPIRAAAQCGSWSAVVHLERLEINMAHTLAIGAKASSVPVSSYRHENWRTGGPSPIIINPEADLPALLAFCWGELKDIEILVVNACATSEFDTQDLASLLYSRVPAVVALLDKLTDMAGRGEIKHV